MLGRRGPAYTAFTTKELRELGQLDDVDVIIDPEDLELDPSSQAVVQQNKVAARNLAVLQEWAARPLRGASRRISFHFWSRPIKIIGNDRVTAVEVERTMIDSRASWSVLAVVQTWSPILWCVRSAIAACRYRVFPSTRRPDGCHMPKAE